MSDWICEDVGLFINELRDKLSEKLNEFDIEDGEKADDKTNGIIKGLNIAYDILDEAADNWICENPSDEVLNKIKEHYKNLEEINHG